MTIKRLTVFVGAALLLLQSVPAWAKDTASTKPRYEWRQTDSSLALIDRGHVVWQLNFFKK